jgi:hypothetical protein
MVRSNENAPSDAGISSAQEGQIGALENKKAQRRFAFGLQCDDHCLWSQFIPLNAKKSNNLYCPVPVRLTLCGLLAALSVKVIAPVRVPTAVGVKVTLIVQLPAAATNVPQVLVCP